MFEHNIGYRFAKSTHAPDGFVEGFTGWGFTAEAAENRAMRKLHSKLENLGQVFHKDSLIVKVSATREELEQCRADWKVSRRSELV